MTDSTTGPSDVRAAFAAAAQAFLEAVRAVGADQWDAPGALGVWTTRELAAHAARSSFNTIEMYLAESVDPDATLLDASGYYRAAMATPNVHEGVADRGRAAGRDFLDPVPDVAARVERVSAVVAAAAGDRVVVTPFGELRLDDYLATRAVELCAHTVDLQLATGQPPSVPADAAAVAVAVLTPLADPMVLLRALLGRAPLPDGFNVLG